MTLAFVSGDIFESKAEALVNPVNAVGVAGKGLALLFKRRFPENNRKYVQACERGDLQAGGIYVTKTDRRSPRWIINFATKNDWRNKSKYVYIDSGLVELREALLDLGINSVAIPALGAGLGGLDWSTVKILMEKGLGGIEGVDIEIYEPKLI